MSEPIDIESNEEKDSGRMVEIPWRNDEKLNTALLDAVLATGAYAPPHGKTCEVWNHVQESFFQSAAGSALKEKCYKAPDPQNKEINKGPGRRFRDQ